jgi:hypothetical protein
MRMLVGSMKLLRVDNDLATLQVAEEMRPAAATAQQDLSTLLSTAWGQPVRVEIESLPPSPPRAGPERGASTPATQPAPAASTTQAAPAPPPPSDISSHPLVKQAMELFGARVVGVQPRRKPAE